MYLFRFMMVTCLAIMPVAVQATVLYSNGAPAQAGGTVISALTRAVAQPFTLTYAANLQSIDFSSWIVDPSNLGNNTSNVPLTVDWRITDTGIGGTLLASGNGASLTMLGATTTFGGNITMQDAQFSLGNIWFAPGTYYLELTNEVVQNQVALGLVGRWGGSTVNGNDGQNYNPPTLTLGQPTHFFEVDGVPEPATLAVLGIGLAGLGVARRRRA